MNEEFKQKLEKTNDYISLIFSQFEIWKTLNNDRKNIDVYNENHYFWIVILNTLKEAPLLELAKLLEKEKEYDLLSIDRLLKEIPESKEKTEVEEELENHKKIIKNLIKRRNKIGAHFELDYTLNPEKIRNEFPLNIEDIENILNSLEKLMGLLESAGSKRGAHYSYETIKTESRFHTKSLVKTLKEKYTEKETNSQKNSGLYTAQQIADKLQVNVMTIYRYIKSGKITAHKIGGEFRIKKEDFDKFLEKTRTN